jgi:Uma2 family endonuclease
MVSTTAITTRRLSIDEFLAMPGFDERRHELIDGEVYEEVSPNWMLNKYGVGGPEARTMIPGDETHSPSSLLPDLVFFREDPETDDWLRTPPDLVIEILSPGQARRDMRIKVETYLGFGVPTVWVVDPERTSVDIYDSGIRVDARGSAKLRASKIPELDVSVNDLFGLVGKPKRR